MKQKTIFAAAIAVLCMTSCSKEVSDEPANSQQVTLTFSPYDYEPFTRSNTNVAELVTHLDVWLYESGSEVTAIHQSSNDAGFATVSVTLDKTKTYTLYAVAHKADGATLSDGVISFTDDKVTHSMFYTTTFSPATTTSLSCLMTRIVADFRLEITDDIPDECKSLRFTIASVFDRWNVTTGGTHALDRVSTIDCNGTSSIFNVYAIVTDAQTLHNITVDAIDANDDVLQTRTFTAVPLRNGYKTNYRGTFFIDTPTAAGFTVGDWQNFEQVTF